jgi:hypothetical protein
MLAIIFIWVLFFSNFTDTVKSENAVFGAFFISLIITAITYPIIILLLSPLFYLLDKSGKEASPDDFAPTKNSSYILSNEGLYIYLPNKKNNNLNLELKIPIPDISAIKTNAQNIEIYTNIPTPRILNIPATEAEALKQHLLRLSADILDANK